MRKRFEKSGSKEGKLAQSDDLKEEECILTPIKKTRKIQIQKELSLDSKSWTPNKQAEIWEKLLCDETSDPP